MIIVRQKQFGKFDVIEARKRGITVDELRKQRAGGAAGVGNVNDIINLRQQSAKTSIAKGGTVNWRNNQRFDPGVEAVNKDRLEQYKNIKNTNKRLLTEKAKQKSSRANPFLITGALPAEQINPNEINARATKRAYRSVNDMAEFDLDRNKQMSEEAVKKQQNINKKNSKYGGNNKKPKGGRQTSQPQQPNPNVNTPKSPSTPPPKPNNLPANIIKEEGSNVTKKASKLGNFMSKHGGKLALGTVAAGTLGYAAYRHHKNKQLNNKE